MSGELELAKSFAEAWAGLKKYRDMVVELVEKLIVRRKELDEALKKETKYTEKVKGMREELERIDVLLAEAGVPPFCGALVEAEEDLEDFFRCDREYLAKLLQVAMKRKEGNVYSVTPMISDIYDYFFWLTLDGLKDPKLAHSLVQTYSQLGTWLCELALEKPAGNPRRESACWHAAFLFSLFNLLALRNEIADFSEEAIPRRNFMESWKETKRKLGLQ